MRRKIPLIYIVGSGHCGSTLLDLILDCHSKIVGIGELYQYKDGKDLICTCGKKIADCDFWKKVFKDIHPKFNFKISRTKIGFLLNKKRFFEFDEDAGEKGKLIDIKEYIDVHEKIYKNILDISGKKIIVASSKDPDRAEVLLSSNKLDITLLHLFRDGRAVSWFYKRKYKNMPNPPGSEARWFSKNLKTEIIRRRNKVKYIFIRYKNFCKDPKYYLEKILKTMGLSFEPEMLNFREKIHHQIEGNRLRFAKDTKIRADMSWKKQMPFLDRIKFNLLFGWLNLVYKIKKSK